MSDDGIDAMYEADLKADTRLLEIWVTYERGERRRVRVFVDTPEGRVIAGKRADEWYELPTVAKVEVVPVGAGLSAGSPVGRTSKAGQDPASSRATCDAGARLCKVHPGPSGRLHHSGDCPDKPGEPISTREYAKGRTWPPRGRVR